MFNRVSKRSFDVTSVPPADKSAIVAERLRISYNSDTKEYSATLSRAIRGDVISIVILSFNDDIVIDGNVNVVNGNTITFLKDTDNSLDGLTAEVKYLSE